MPGMASWRQLYRIEHEQLYEEGYPVAGGPVPDANAPYLPLPEHDERRARETDIAEAEWEAAYHRLWEVRKQGLRPGYPYREPDGFDEILADPAGPMPSLAPLNRAEYQDRVAGAWYGRCAGVTLGKPVEMVLKDDIRQYLQSVGSWPLRDYIPARSAKLDKELKCHDSTAGNIRYVPVDDDISYTVTALRLIEEHGREFTKEDVCRNWLAYLPYGRLYSCTKQAYYHLVNMTGDRPQQEQIDELPLKLNPMREGLNASIRIDLFGFISPADPLAAARMAHRMASVNSVKNGIYAAMFVAACIAAALSRRPSVETILAAGLAVIPSRSRLAEAIRLTREWYHEARGEWEPVCDRVYRRWGHLNWAGVMYNYPLVVLALIHGDLDFTRSVGTAAMCGVDTDCTAGTVGGIVGAALGRAGLERRWYAPFNDQVRTFVAGNGFGDGTVSDLVRRTVACGMPPAPTRRRAARPARSRRGSPR